MALLDPTAMTLLVSALFAGIVALINSISNSRRISASLKLAQTKLDKIHNLTNSALTEQFRIRSVILRSLSVQLDISHALREQDKKTSPEALALSAKAAQEGAKRADDAEEEHKKRMLADIKSITAATAEENEAVKV